MNGPFLDEGWESIEADDQEQFRFKDEVG